MAYDFISITDTEFENLSKLIYDHVGIHLTEKKKSLVRGRLNKHLNNLGLESFSDYLEHLKKDNSGAELVELVNRISTNHTYFFREDEHFKYLQNTIFPRFLELHGIEKEIRIWCAGCASGEEAYTLAIVVSEFFKNYPEITPKILATDISTKALKHAVEGIYIKERIESVPSALLSKYFRKVDDDKWQINERLKQIIRFRRLNFLDDHFPFKKKFHTIFCRNVMIYFDKATKDNLIEKFYRHLYPGEALFIGHSETLGREQGYFQFASPSIYFSVEESQE